MDDPEKDVSILKSGGQLLVRFAESRDVLNADGNYLGRTNRLLGISTGQHTITLSGLEDFSPTTRQVAVVGGQVTTAEFEKDGV